MKILAKYGRDDLAMVYVAQMRDGDPDTRVEFVESLQPPHPRDKKWVVIVSSLYGCPGGCRFCDAGGNYRGRLTAEEIASQVDWLVRNRFPGGIPKTEKFKIQFARMGEPALNPSVLDAMEMIAQRYPAQSLNLSLSTIGPASSQAQDFFSRLAGIKNRHFAGGRFQLQFSLHTTDEERRKELVPLRTMDFSQIAGYGKSFRGPSTGDKKVTLNFAPVEGYPVEPKTLLRHFDPGHFLVKLTPLNPTVSAMKNGLRSALDPHSRDSCGRFVEMFTRAGYETLLSIGELEENAIGSNCGMYVQRAAAEDARPQGSYASLGKGPFGISAQD